MGIFLLEIPTWNLSGGISFYGNLFWESLLQISLWEFTLWESLSGDPLVGIWNLSQGISLLESPLGLSL